MTHLLLYIPTYITEFSMFIIIIIINNNNFVDIIIIVIIIIFIIIIVVLMNVLLILVHCVMFAHVKGGKTFWIVKIE